MSMVSFAGYVKRIRASVAAYKACVPQHDEHLYAWRAWMFTREFRKPRRRKVGEARRRKVGEVTAKIYKTSIIGIGPWCVGFKDGEIITTRTEDRARSIAMVATGDLAKPRRRKVGEVTAKIYKTSSIGIGPWCVEFEDGEIITTRTEDRARSIAMVARG